MVPRAFTRRSHPNLVGHHVTRAAEALLRRVGEEVRDARRVETGVVVDLLPEARLLRPLFQERAPIGVEAKICSTLERSDLGLDLPKLAADALYGALEAHAVRFELGRTE